MFAIIIYLIYSASNKAGSNRTGSNSGEKRGRKNSSCGSPRQPKSTRPKGGSIGKRDRVTSMIDLGPSVMGSPLDTDNFTPGCLSSPFSFNSVSSTSDLLSTQDNRVVDTMLPQSMVQSICKPDGHKLCKVESEQIQSGEITIEKVDSFNAVSYSSMVEQKGITSKPIANEDYRSVKALEITDIDLEHIFDEDQEDDQVNCMYVYSVYISLHCRILTSCLSRQISRVPILSRPVQLPSPCLLACTHQAQHYPSWPQFTPPLPLLN